MKALLGFIFTYLVSTIVVAAGGMHGGGTDQYPIDHESAWFTGTQPVSYCLEVDPGFGVTRSFATRKIEAAAKTWRDYLAVVGETRSNGPTLHLKYESSCTDQTELRILLGVDSVAVQQHRSGLINPFGFAYKQHYDAESGRGRGYIWLRNPVVEANGSITPNWRLQGVLETTLLHELGHVLGIGHVDGTVMKARFAEHLLGPESSFQVYAGKIDWEKVLVPCELQCTRVFQGRLGENGHDDKVFRDLFGVQPSGSIRARFSEGDGLVVEDDNGRHSVSYRKVADSSRSALLPVFRWVRLARVPGQEQPAYFVRSRFHFGQVLVAELQTVDGRRLPILVSKNLDFGSNQFGLLRVQWMASEGLRTIFSATNVVKLSKEGK